MSYCSAQPSRPHSGSLGWLFWHNGVIAFSLVWKAGLLNAWLYSLYTPNTFELYILWSQSYNLHNR